MSTAQWHRDNFLRVSGSNHWKSNQKNYSSESLQFRVNRADIKPPPSVFNIWLILAHNSVKWHKSNYSPFRVPFSSFFLVSLYEYRNISYSQTIYKPRIYFATV